MTKLLLTSRSAALCFALSGALSAATPKDVAGEWNLVSQVNEDSLRCKLSLQEAEGKLAGKLTCPDESASIRDAALTNDELSFKVTLYDATSTVTLKLAGDTAAGGWQAGDNSGKITATRAASSTGGASTAASADGILGTWMIAAETPGGDVLRFPLTIKNEGGKATVTARTDRGEMSGDNVALTTDSLSYTNVLNGEKYTIKVTLKDGKLAGTWEGGGSTGKVTGTRQGA